MKQLISRRKITSHEGMSEAIDKVQTHSKLMLLQYPGIELFDVYECAGPTPTVWHTCGPQC